jgi:hypothetical protein
MDNTTTTRRMSLASRAGSLVRQVSSRAGLASEEAAQPLAGRGTATTAPSAKMALFHTRTASVHVENGEWSLALQSHNRALIHYRKLHGQDSAPCAATLVGIGVCLMNLAHSAPGPHQARMLDEESRLCREYVRSAECALREARYIRGRLHGPDSEEVEEVEMNLELLLGSKWDDAAEETTTAVVTNPSSRSLESLGGNNFRRAALRLFGGGAASDAGKVQPSSSGNDTASSSSSSSSLSSHEEQIDFNYPTSPSSSSSSSSGKANEQSASIWLGDLPGERPWPPLVDVHLSAKDQEGTTTPLPPSSSSDKSSISSSAHSTGSFGDKEEKDDDDDDIEDVLDGIDGISLTWNTATALPRQRIRVDW